MADENHNDNDAMAAGVSASGFDAHGEAALLLVESLLHALTERKILTVADAVDIVETAVEVIGEAAADVGRPLTKRTPIVLLQAISTSLRHDL